MAVIPSVEKRTEEVSESDAGQVEIFSPSVSAADEPTAAPDEMEPEPAPVLVDFDALCAENQDVIGWLYCPDTPIHYPVVQTTDNEFYLHRLLDGRKNSAGTLFMDYRNAGDLSDWNSVIYGHNMINDSMFGSLTDFKRQEYFEEHPKMYLLTPERNFSITLLAGFTTAADDELYSTFTPSGEEQRRLVNKWLEASDFYAGIDPAEEDVFITLSTCSYEYDNARYVLVGVLRELGTAR